MNHRIGTPARLTRQHGLKSAFSLVEVLTVLAIISIVAAFAVPTINGIRDAQNVNAATETISGTLQRARAYAMSHNTYVWVGFYEEAANAPAPTNVFPYTGSGRVVVGMVASVDGTQIYADSATGAALPAARLMPVEKLIKFQDVHVTDVGAPAGTGSALATRPAGAYAGGSTLAYGINSDNTSEETPYPFTLNSYTFYKTIRFSPSGEASIDGNPALRRVGEIDIRPTHGTMINQSSSNVVAIQFTGIGGGVQTYRN